MKGHAERESIHKRRAWCGPVGRGLPCAFTLVELLVAIAIVLVVAGLSATAVGMAQKQARGVECLSGMRQIGVAVRTYVGDYNGRLPNTSHARTSDGTSLGWSAMLEEYLGEGFIGRCLTSPASAAMTTYAWNDLLADSDGIGIAAVRCERPTMTFALGETADKYLSEHFHFSEARSKVTFNQFKAEVGVERHGSGANYLFVDGHAERLSATVVRARLASTDPVFLKP